MNFCWVTFNVRNMDESLKFYQEIIGLKISERFNVGEDLDISMLGETDGTKVELIYNKKQNVLTRTEGLSIGFEVKSLDEAMELANMRRI
jgi:lactoylglutathione lyase